MDKSDVQETLVSLYLRLNGYFVSGFIVHAPYGVTTELDVLAVRFPKHQETEREVQCSPHLGAPSDCIDFVIGEVKGGAKNANFNSRFRSDPEAIRTVLHRFGAFPEEEIDRVCAATPELLEPEKIKKSQTFPTLEVCGGSAQLRFILFVPEQRRENNETRPYIFENDLLDFAWTCFRPEQQRQRCDVRYNYDLWGPQFAEMVRYLKDPSRSSPGGIDELYGLYHL